MKNLLKNTFFALAPKRLPETRAVILMYHSINDRPDYFASVKPENFARQMAYIADKKMPVISLGELVRRIKLREPLGGSVVITFDDGYRDNLTVAYPILKKYNFPATIFVTTGVGGRLSPQEMRQMGDLVEFGGHTASHPKLTKLSAIEARAEIAESKQALEQALGKPCRFFAYPFGNYSTETLAVVRESGFESAVTVKEGTVGPESKLFELPRVSIDRSTTFAQFKGKLSTAVDRYERLKLWR